MGREEEEGKNTAIIVWSFIYIYISTYTINLLDNVW